MPESDPYIDPSLGIYNPGSLAPEVLLQEFIVRRQKLEKALESVRESKVEHTPQHLLILGPRGIGKTMFLLALAYSIEKDPELDREWIPVIFPEEIYGIGDLADFWLYAATVLLEKLENIAGIDEVETLREGNPSDIEEQSHRLFLKYLTQSGKRAFLVIENLDEFFDSVTDQEEQHRLRAFLMESDRLLFAASAVSYFKSSGDIDLPFYDFFRVFRLERFNREEVLEALRSLAESRDDKHVLETLKNQPERIDSLRVLTGGNPRLVKMIYRLLQEGGTGTARQDLDRLLEDCTPYFKHRIEDLKTEERRVFDHVARHWDPVAVGDIQTALRRKSNQVSTYLSRLIDKGFLEEAEGSTRKRKSYQVAERFYNIYYLMRFSRSGKKRLAWLIQAMRVLYSENDFRQWTKQTLAAWKDTADPNHRADRETFLYSLTSAVESEELRGELIHQTIHTAWEKDQLQSLSQIIDRRLAQETLGPTFDLITFFSNLPQQERKRTGYDPENAEWWFEIGSLLSDSKNYILEEEAYRNAINIDSKYSSPWNNLGVLLMDELQRYNEAEEAYLEAIKIDSAHARPWNNLGILLQKHLQRYDEAEAAYRKALDIDSNFAQSWSNIGFLFHQLQRYDEAEEAYRKALDIDSDFAHSWNCLGFLLQHLQRYQEAEEAYNKAIEIDSNYVGPWYGRGSLLQHLQRYEEAEDAYKKAIVIDSNFAQSYSGLSELLQKLERNSEAQAAALQGVILGPENPWIRNQFLTLCAESPSAWKKLLLHLIKHSTKSAEAELREFTLRGLIFLLSENHLTLAEVTQLITEQNAQEIYDDILLALNSLENPALLIKASPERQAFARDFLVKTGLNETQD